MLSMKGDLKVLEHNIKSWGFRPFTYEDQEVGDDNNAIERRGKHSV